VTLELTDILGIIWDSLLNILSNYLRGGGFPDVTTGSFAFSFCFPHLVSTRRPCRDPATRKENIKTETSAPYCGSLSQPSSAPRHPILSTSRDPQFRRSSAIPLKLLMATANQTSSLGKISIHENSLYTRRCVSSSEAFHSRSGKRPACARHAHVFDLVVFCPAA
jgi:hypothetical protein